MFRFKTRKKIYVVRSPGSALFDEARFVLKEGAGGLAVGRSERELAREAERIIAEYGLLPFPGKDAGRAPFRRAQTGPPLRPLVFRGDPHHGRALSSCRLYSQNARLTGGRRKDAGKTVPGRSRKVDKNEC